MIIKEVFIKIPRTYGGDTMKELMKIKTSFAEPGMTIGKDVYSSSDYLIAGEGAVLTDRMITRLKFYSVELQECNL